MWKTLIYFSINVNKLKKFKTTSNIKRTRSKHRVSRWLETWFDDDDIPGWGESMRSGSRRGARCVSWRRRPAAAPAPRWRHRHRPAVPTSTCRRRCPAWRPAVAAHCHTPGRRRYEWIAWAPANAAAEAAHPWWEDRRRRGRHRRASSTSTSASRRRRRVAFRGRGREESCSGGMSSCVEIDRWMLDTINPNQILSAAARARRRRLIWLRVERSSSIRSTTCG